ncbi:MAG: MBL fold metallo-hydrolase [Bacteroidota bacterium]
MKEKRSSFAVAPGVAGLRIWIANIYMISQTDSVTSDTSDDVADKSWVLVDAGLVNSNTRIMRVAESLFGYKTKPSAILLTHGHFDHIGALHQLAVDWDVPVYAHLLELPYLTGRSDYPPPDPTVGGGAMTWISGLYPTAPINLGERVQPLPPGGEVPGLPDWRWIHTPGHSPGHVSFYRDSDRTLIAGDAFVTVNQESLLAVIQQKPEIHRPPAYFTSNWRLARQSVQDLADLQPEVVATGHGLPMRGEAMQDQLRYLADNFEQIAIPAHGRYTSQPARIDEQGAVVFIPPAPPNPIPKVLLGIGVALLTGAALFSYWKNKNKQELQQSWEVEDY